MRQATEEVVPFGGVDSRRRASPWPWIVLALVLAATAAVRWRRADVPLERDEGEYALAGQLILEGEPPYGLAYSMKFPGTNLAYAAILGTLGQTARGVHLGLLVANLATIGLVFLIGRATAGDRAAVAAAAVFALLSAGESVLGMAAHASHFVVLPALAGLLLLLRGCEGRRVALATAGVGFGLAILAKQPGVLFLAFALVYTAWVSWRKGVLGGRGVVDLGLLAAGALAPLLAACAWLAAAGVFGRFWLWSVTYARAYGGEISLAGGWAKLQLRAGVMFAEFPLLWLLAAAGAAVLVARRRRGEAAPFLLGLAAFSFLSMCPGLHLRAHYFVQLLPAAALLAGTAMETLGAWVAARRGVAAGAVVFSAVLAIALVASAWPRRGPLFTQSPDLVALVAYAGNPFREAPEVARYIRERTRPDDRIAVIGSEPEIYFYAHRKPATGYIYTYPLMEPQPFADKMAREMMREIEDAKPRYLVVVTNKLSWLKNRNSSSAIFDWAPGFLNEHYEICAIIENAGTADPRSRWDVPAESGRELVPESVTIARRIR